MPPIPKLTTKAACRVARIDRDRFNEHVAGGRFPCAPITIPGRARLFTPEDLVPLWLFQELTEDGYDSTTAGRIACEVARVARVNPEAPVIALVWGFTAPPTCDAVIADHVPAPGEWGTTLFGGGTIRRVDYFNIAKTREFIARAIEEEQAVIGERD